MCGSKARAMSSLRAPGTSPISTGRWSLQELCGSFWRRERFSSLALLGGRGAILRAQTGISSSTRGGALIRNERRTRSFRSLHRPSKTGVNALMQRYLLNPQIADLADIEIVLAAT